MKGIVSKGSEFESMAAQDLNGSAGKLIANPTSEEQLAKRIAEDISLQTEISEYNIDLQNAHHDKRFTDKTFTGKFVIVKLEKINWLVPSEYNPEMHTINPLYFIQVVTPDFPKGKLIQNPLPYGYKGTVVAVGDEVIQHRFENKLDPICVGDTVELSWFDLKEYRYYPDKQKIDQITLDSPYTPNYEGFAKVPVQFIESFVPAGMYEEVYGKPEDIFKVTINDVTLKDYNLI
jgi:hypothetical protein